MLESKQGKKDEWVIHFFRERSLREDWAGHQLEAFWDFTSATTPFDVMSTSILLGGLLPDCPVAAPWLTYKGLRTAISASEDTFPEMLRLEGRSSNETGITGYGVALLRSEFSAAGGVQASARDKAHLKYSADGDWYWRPSDPFEDCIQCSGYQVFSEATVTPGLPIWDLPLRPDVFSRVLVIVENRHEAAFLQNLFTALDLASVNQYGTIFDSSLINATRIVVLDDIRTKFEKSDAGWLVSLSDLSNDDSLPSLLSFDEPVLASQTIERGFAAAAEAAEVVGATYLAGNAIGRRGRGDVELSIPNSREPFVHSLLESGWARMSRTPDKLAVDIRHDWPLEHSLEYVVAVYTAASEVLEEVLGLPFEVNVITDEF